MGGLDTPTSGDVIFNGQPMSKLSSAAKAELRNQKLGFIYQFHHLLPDFTALENVAMPLLIGKKKPAEINSRALEMLKAVGLEHRANHRPSELSGGERQRVAIARALVNDPQLIIADEPTGNVDPEMSHEIVELLTKINNAGTTVIMVTHEHDLVRSFQRRVIVIKNGEVVSDTPDPTHARFESSEPRKETDMFFYEEGTSIDLSKTADARTDEDVFDNLESLADETPAQAAATPEDENGGAAE